MKFEQQNPPLIYWDVYKDTLFRPTDELTDKLAAVFQRFSAETMEQDAEWRDEPLPSQKNLKVRTQLL